MPAVTNILEIVDLTAVTPEKLEARLKALRLDRHRFIIDTSRPPCACETARERFLARLAASRKTHGAELFGDLPEWQP